ncbi:hypothetical protein JCM9534A_18250 [Catenuloplanes indicus JCM 9534]
MATAVAVADLAHRLRNGRRVRCARGRLAAAIVGTAAAGVAGIFSARAQESINRRPITAGTVTHVRDLTNPIVLGVHPAAKARTGTGEADRVPQFVRRDAYAALRRSAPTPGTPPVNGEAVPTIPHADKR